MLELSRTIRFCLNDPTGSPGGRHNTFAAWPAMRGLGRYYELTVTCHGHADPLTGYFINIKHIDQAVHQHALPIFHQTLTSQPGGEVPLGHFMRRLVETLDPALHHTVGQIGLRLTPTCQIQIRRHDMDHVLIRQQYEFSAAHRLHVPSMSDEANRQVFGKCNNPAGHGHNYRLEVVVRSRIDEHGRTLDVATLDQLVDQYVIDKLDHKHLNLDVPQFKDLNPSVENIVRVIWDMLADPISETWNRQTMLHELSVWETSKTVCTYRGPARAETPARG
ncbi:MAG: 6-carboxytetrahydropterin synthase [Phycisphaeraceae bacterium]